MVSPFGLELTIKLYRIEMRISTDESKRTKRDLPMFAIIIR